MLVECLTALARRWIWTTTAVVVALACGLVTFTVVHPVQEAQSQVLFLPAKKQAGVPDPTNPFLNLGGSVAIVATAVRIMVDSSEVHKKIYDSGHTGEFKIENNLSDNAGPTLIVTVDDPVARMSLDTLKAVIGEIDNSLEAVQQQQGVDHDLFVSALPLTTPTRPEVIRKRQIQFAVMAFGLVLAVLISSVLLLDRRFGAAPPRHALSNFEDEARIEPST